MIFRGQVTGLKAGDVLRYQKSPGIWKFFRNIEDSADNRMCFQGTDDGWYFNVKDRAVFEGVCTLLAATCSLRPVFSSDQEQAVWVVNLRSLDQ
jgi:hypothetical protein